MAERRDVQGSATSKCFDSYANADPIVAVRLVQLTCKKASDPYDHWPAVPSPL